MKVSDLLIYGGTVLTMNERLDLFENGYVLIENGLIKEVGSKRNLPKAKKILEAKNSLILPGLVNGHTHTGMTLLRGVADDIPLYPWLHEHIFPLERKFGTKEFVFLGTLLATLEMIRGGTTLFNDMYYFEEQAAKAVELSGLTALCGQTIVDISGVEPSSQILDKFEKYREAVLKFKNVIACVAPHSIYGVSTKAWPELIGFARKHGMPMHVHLSEMKDEQEETLKKLGKTPTQFFEEVGLWSSGPTIAAHAVAISKEDLQILGKYRVGISHNPESNLKLSTTICPVAELREAGARVALGTDGSASNNNLNLFSEADFAAKLQVLKYGVGRLKAVDIVKMLTFEGATALGQGERTGSLEVGKSADLIVVDLSGPHAMPLYDPYSHLVYSASAQDVRHTIVRGKVLMKDRRILSLDEKQILNDAKKWGKKIARFRSLQTV